SEYRSLDRINRISGLNSANSVHSGLVIGSLSYRPSGSGEDLTTNGHQWTRMCTNSESSYKRKPSCLFVSIRGYLASYAFFSSAMSILSISIIAFMTRSAFALSGSLSMSPRTTGLTCHDNPNLSLSQPHGPVDPPSAESFSQK